MLRVMLIAALLAGCLGLPPAPASAQESDGEPQESIAPPANPEPDMRQATPLDSVSQGYYANYPARGYYAPYVACPNYPRKYPALRAFGPASAKEAFREAIRSGVAYAIRMVVEVSDDMTTVPEIRARFLVRNSAGDAVYEPIEVIAKEPDYKEQLMAELENDLDAFSRKQRSVLAEIRRLISTP